jgi:hypothetical protein
VAAAHAREGEASLRQQAAFLISSTVNRFNAMTTSLISIVVEGAHEAPPFLPRDERGQEGQPGAVSGPKLLASAPDPAGLVPGTMIPTEGSVRHESGAYPVK